MFLSKITHRRMKNTPVGVYLIGERLQTENDGVQNMAATGTEMADADLSVK